MLTLSKFREAMGKYMAFDSPYPRHDDYGRDRYPNPMQIPIHIWRALPPQMCEEFMRAYDQHGKDPGFREYMLRKSRQIYEDLVIKGKVPPEIFFDEVGMLRAAGQPIIGPIHLPGIPETLKIPFERPAEVQKFDAAGIVISYEEDREHDCITVKLKLPTATVAGTTMPDAEKKLFDALMRSRKISDQLVGLEALVRHEENRLADKKEKEDAAST